jgi:5-oxoprolinase (ATP-hydrolysing)
MIHIQSCAESAVRDMLRAFSLQEGMQEQDSVSAIDYLDDGTPIALTVHIDRSKGSAVFDFTGTGVEMYGNLNAPPAVTTSAIIYCLRCLLPSSDIPLNQGCLAPIEIIIPPNSVLNPSPETAVVGGNVTTSQRVTDVVLKAFRACAASQGCMNNLTFGDKTMGYYETIAVRQFVYSIYVYIYIYIYICIYVYVCIYIYIYICIYIYIFIFLHKYLIT